MENNFTFIEREPTNKKSITFMMENSANLAEKNNTRLPKTIHGSSFFRCPHQMLLEAYGVPYTDGNFNWSNQQAAKAGDYGHLQIQEELVQNGLAIKIPAFNFNTDIEELKKSRNKGLTENAIEVDINKFSTPYSTIARKKYLEAGFYTHDSSYSDNLKRYRLGIRVDAIIRLPWYESDIPFEIKTVKPEYWEGGKNHRLFEAKMQKYMYQLQMQMAWWHDSTTGKTPEWGIIYVVNRADTSKRIERYVKYDSDFIDMWLPRIEAIKKSWDKGELPEPVPSPDDCAWCKYYSICTSPDKYPPLQYFVASSKAKKRAKLQQENNNEQLK